MSLKLEVMTDDALRAQVLTIVREQVKPIVEALVRDGGPLQAVIADVVGKLAARPEVVQSYREELRREMRFVIIETARAEVSRRAQGLVVEMRATAQKFFEEEQLRVKGVADAIIRQLGEDVLDTFADKVAARLAARLGGR
jgi:hypothetical protein